MDNLLLPDDGLIHLVGWPDALADSLGHPVRSDYTETYWLGILGPTATWLLLRCSDALAAHPEGCDLSLGPLAQSLGLVFHPGRANPFSRAFDRLVMFGMLRHVSSRPVHTFAARSRVPPLSGRQLARLPVDLQRSHACSDGRQPPVVSVRA